MTNDENNRGTTMKDSIRLALEIVVLIPLPDDAEQRIMELERQDPEDPRWEMVWALFEVAGEPQR